MPVVQSICDSTSIGRTEHINWILVIEKEVRRSTSFECFPLTIRQATFNALVEREFYLHPVLGSGLLVTVSKALVISRPSCTDR